jgi:CarD family transcriptional regulator
MRTVIDACEVCKVYDILRKEHRSRQLALEQAVQEYMERLKSGSIYEVATVLKELYNLRYWKELPSARRRCSRWRANLSPRSLHVAGHEELIVEQEIEEIFLANNNSQKGNTANHHKG